MEQSIKVTNIKNESTDSTSNDRLIISSDLPLNSVKQESDCLVQSEIYIKKEPQEVKNEYPIVASTSNDLYPNNDMKFEMEEPLIKIEYEDMLDEIMQDPLDVGGEIKVREHFLIDLNQGESGIRTEPIEKLKDEHLLETDKDNSSQDRLLIKNDSDRKDKKYVCDVCNKTFTEKRVLINHSRIHTGEKPFTCDFCEKSFSVKCNLDKHMRIHTGEKPYICNECKKVFRQKSTLNEHKLIHSGIKSFSCKECNKSFTQKHNLVTHRRIHSGEKPFACDVCKKTFADTSTLTKHKRTHTGEKPYTCNICTKSFTQKSNLNQHKKTHSN